jgi:hypothetical protein
MASVIALWSPNSTIWRAAKPLMRQHGVDADLEAARLQDRKTCWSTTEATTRGGSYGH